MTIEELLLTVQKPGRYSGGEWNSVRKEWTPDKVKVCLAFPDTYEVGMSYLGMKILYGILNRRSDCIAERVFSPWIDLEAALRSNRIPLFSLESRRPLKEFDVIGISIANELAGTNILNLLDLGGLPIRSSERDDASPLIIAGGPSCYNPEPLAEFIDAFVIGDGEEVIDEIVDAAMRAKKSGVRRHELLSALAETEGIYVPSLCAGENRPVVHKRVVRDFENAYYPVDQIVPNIQIVHDRIAIEIMRGCKHACKFCQAVATYRPCRERSKDKVLEIARKTYENTGHDEISLLSLSSGDHSKIADIITDMNALFRDKAVSISVPSLRIEDVLVGLPSLLSAVKKPGLTFAPEAGSERLRRYINKNIDIDKLYSAVSGSFRSGWRKVKLYFMIGLPTETDEDIAGIADISQKVSELRREVDGKLADVNVSVNAFVPKPHTPFARESMQSIDELARKRSLLIKSVRSRFIKLDFHSFDMSLVESVIARGDRKVSQAIYEAWKRGARFDGWQERFSINTWTESFKAADIDAELYAHRKRGDDEVLPWSFIKI